MFTYHRTVYYHETDKMGIVHHSNYLKWMEEARVAYLDAIGMSFVEVEKRGIGSPIVEVNVKYKKPTTFGDEVRVELTPTKYNGIRLEIDYSIVIEGNGEISNTAHTTNCFIKDGKVVNLKNEAPDYHERLMEEMQ